MGQTCYTFGGTNRLSLLGGQTSCPFGGQSGFPFWWEKQDKQVISFKGLSIFGGQKSCSFSVDKQVITFRGANRIPLWGDKHINLLGNRCIFLYENLFLNFNHLMSATNRTTDLFPFSSRVARAKAWLRENPAMRVRYCETIELGCGAVREGAALDTQSVVHRFSASHRYRFRALR